MLFKIIILLMNLLLIEFVNGHGSMYEPPSRNSAWRTLRDFPADYNDNSVMDDDICGNERHSLPGKIAKVYKTGQIIRVHSVVCNKIVLIFEIINNLI